jgi:hypothetical protein
MALLLVAGLVLRNLVLNQAKKRIQAVFNYARIHASLVPPRIVIEDVRTPSTSPFLSASRIVIRVSYLALFSKEKALDVSLERPVLRIYELPFGGGPAGQSKGFLSLPFAVRRGLVKGGELYYWGKRGYYHGRGINALFQQRGDSFSLQSTAQESSLFFGKGGQFIQGQVSFLAEGRGERIDFRKIRIGGSGLALSASGWLRDIRNPEVELETSLHLPLELVARALSLPFDWQGKTDGQGTLALKEGKWQFKADLGSSDLVLNSVPMGPVKGSLEYDQKAGGRLELALQKRPLPRESVTIRFGGGKVYGEASGFHLDPIIKYYGLPWPVKSPAWGRFAVERGNLTVDAELREESFIAQPGKYPFSGKVQLSLDRNKVLMFSSEDLQSSFARVGVQGKVEIDRSVNVKIKGDVGDVRQAREFASLVLRKSFGIPEIRGKGRCEVDISGKANAPGVRLNFSLAPAGFDRFEARAVEGVTDIKGGEISGNFEVNDPSLQGAISLLSRKDSGLEVNIRAKESRLEQILPALRLSLPLEGWATGNLEVRQKADSLRVSGDISSPSLKLGSQNLKDVQGRWEWQGEALSLERFQFAWHDGRFQGNASLDWSSQEYDLDVSGSDIHISSIFPKGAGVLSLNLKGKGLLGKDLATGTFSIKDLKFTSSEKAEISGETELGYSSDRLSLSLKGAIRPGENEISASLNIPFKGKSITADLKGYFGNLDLLIPWRGAKGRINYLAEVRSASPAIEVNGVIDFQGPVFPIPKFAHALTDYTGLIFIQNNRASVRSFQAKLGGGDVFGSGEIVLGGGGLDKINVAFEGKNLRLSPLERASALADGSLRLIKDSAQFGLEGNIRFLQVFWRREISEKLVFSSSPYYESQREPSLYDDLTLNLRLSAADNAWMENSLGRVRGRFDLQITGNMNAPIVMGDIEALGGDVYFQDRKFKILKGQLSFFNPAAAEPYLDFRGETYLKDYRVTFSLNGLVNRLRPEFSSSPPLPPEDVLALLALGEAFKRTYSYDTSTQLSTASLLSFELAEQAKKRAVGLFSLDRFRIDPFIMGSSSEMTARLTVGKRLSKNLFIHYSTNLTSQREEIVRMEWDLSGDFSVVGIRNEFGRISFDIKYRKRF